MKFRTTITAFTLAAVLMAASAFAQLPGPPVGVPQANQSLIHGYNFQYPWTPAGADGSGVMFQPTISTSILTSQTVDGVRVSSTIVLPNSTASGTTLTGMRILASTFTVNGATVTNGANLKIEAAPTGPTNNYSLWSVGNVRLDASLISGTGGALTLPTAAGGLPVVLDCGATGTGNQTCAPVAATAATKIYAGSSTLASNAAVITFPTAFAATTSYQCVANDITTRANPVQMISTSTTTATITNTTGASDVINWICVGQ